MELTDLYQELIVDHNRNPRNFGRIEDATHQAEGFNPLCGDKVSIYLNVKDGVVQDVAFEGCGCAISIASASLLSEAVKAKPVNEVVNLFETMRSVLTGDQIEIDRQALGKLAALEGVKAFPSRIKCAILSWHALNSALSDGQPVRSE